PHLELAGIEILSAIRVIWVSAIAARRGRSAIGIEVPIQIVDAVCWRSAVEPACKVARCVRAADRGKLATWRWRVGVVLDRACRPQCLGDAQGRDLLVRPPGLLIALPVQRLMMGAAQGDGELIADLATERLGLSEFQMVGIARGLLAHEAGL